MILVFGGNGQLGQELARAASLQRIALRTLTHKEVDIADSAAVAAAISRFKPQLVVNAAAYTKVDLAETNVAEARRGNEIGPGVLARWCSDASLPMVHLSSDYVFDGTRENAYRETDAVCPVSVYGRTKAAGEAEIRAGLGRHVILRTAWVYSEFGDNFLKTILNLAASRDELRVVADQRGSPTSAREIADVILRIAPRVLRGDDIWGTYHFTAEGVTTWHGFASRIVGVQAVMTGRNPAVIPIRTSDYPTAAARPANSHLDCGLFSRVFGFSGGHWTENVDRTTRALLKSSGQTSHVA